MFAPLQIIWRGLEESEALETLIQTRTRKLQHLYADLGGCRVLLERPHRHKHLGEAFHVRIELMVPGGEVVVEREPARTGRHDDPYVAVSDAFRVARRELQEHVQKRRGFVKRHEPAHAPRR